MIITAYPVFESHLPPQGSPATGCIAAVGRISAPATPCLGVFMPSPGSQQRTAALVMVMAAATGRQLMYLSPAATAAAAGQAGPGAVLRHRRGRGRGADEGRHP